MNTPLQYSTIVFYCCIFLFPVIGNARHFTSEASGDGIVAVAVSEFETPGVAADLRWLGRSCSDAVIDRLWRTKKVRVVEREFLEKIIKELKFQESGLVNESSAVTLGNLVGATTFVLGTLSQFGNDIVIRCRVVSVERGTVLGSAETKNKKENILQIQQEIAEKIAYILSPDAAASGNSPFSSAVPLAVQSEIDKMKRAAVAFPLTGLDPMRAGKLASYTVWIAACDRIIASQPDYASAFYYRALFNFQSQEYVLAQNDCLQAISLKMSGAEPSLLLANIYRGQKKYDAALAVLKKAASVYTSDSRPWYAIASLQIQLGDKGSAIEAFVASLWRTPYIEQAESGLRTLTAGSEDRLRQTLGPKRSDLIEPVRLFRWFWNGSPVIDETAALSAIRNFPDLYLGYYALGLDRMQQGNREGALNAFQTALKLRPSFPEVHRELGRLLIAGGECRNGTAHITLYLQTAEYVDDFGPLRKLMDGCAD